MEVQPSESEKKAMAKATNPGRMLQIRMLPEIEAEFRKLTHQRGDVRAVVMGMFECVDLNSVPLPEMLFRRKSRLPKPTTVLNFPVELREKIKAVAKERGCSMNALMNGGLKLFIDTYNRKRSTVKPS